jgi:hypothetical protein
LRLFTATEHLFTSEGEEGGLSDSISLFTTLGEGRHTSGIISYREIGGLLFTVD